MCVQWGANFENRWFLLSDDEKSLGEQLMEQAVKLYDAFDGEGLARFDIRMEAATGKLMVLDVNPNCSLVSVFARETKQTARLSASH